jgi:Ser-tRNA(Ala) deacylase AlaX
VAKASNLWNSKRTFGGIDAEAIGGQHIKDLLEVGKVICPFFAENVDVV